VEHWKLIRVESEARISWYMYVITTVDPLRDDGTCYCVYFVQRISAGQSCSGVDSELLDVETMSSAAFLYLNLCCV
jgi:hypothetical protein